MWFPRSYIRGFVAGNYLDNFHMSGQDLVFDYLPANLHLVYRVSDQFFPANSNSYTLSFVFDVDNCFGYIAGVPVSVLTYVGFSPVGRDQSWRIWVASDVPTDENKLADLPRMPSSYWDYPT